MKRNKIILAIFILGLIVLIFPHVMQYYHNLDAKNKSMQLRESVQAMPNDTKEAIAENMDECNENIKKNEPGTYDPFTEDYSNFQYNECGQVIDKVQNEEKNYFISGFGSIEIPKLNIELPLFLGASDEHLNYGAAQIEGSSLPTGGIGTHTAIAGHRGGIIRENFRYLDQLDDGDIFIIYALGKKMTYRVYHEQIILPNETDILAIDAEKDLASLVTCHPYRVSTHRLVVQGERID